MTRQKRLRSVEAAAGTAPRLSGRVEHAVLRHSAPGWQQRAGVGQRHRRQPRAPQAPVWQTREGTSLYPRHTAARVDSSDEARVVVFDTACGVRRRYRGRPPGRPTEGASAASTMPAKAASAVFASVRRRHEPLLAVRTSVRPNRVGDDNGRRATTAVMRNGYRRGECFEGYEPRCGERCRAARPVGAGTFGFTKQTARGRYRETQRTLSGSDCNMSEPPERSKPSRW
jgi:hypothetical protein